MDSLPFRGAAAYKRLRSDTLQPEPNRIEDSVAPWEASIAGFANRLRRVARSLKGGSRPCAPAFSRQLGVDPLYSFDDRARRGIREKAARLKEPEHAARHGYL